MNFPPLKRGVLLRRYKRFLADMRLDNGEEITAHCANPGSMLAVAIPGSEVWVSTSNDKSRKLKHSWVLTRLGKTLVPINTTNPNRIVREALEADLIPELGGFQTLRAEVKYGENSRIDFLIEYAAALPRAYVEVKNVHLVRTRELAEFPDSVTRRGAKHLDELMKIAGDGKRAVMLFVVQRSDCKRFRPADDLDPAYGAKLREAAQNGVELLCYDCEVTLEHVTLRRRLPIELGFARE
jgi:sugar fermentation stimulation protein A